MNKLILYIFFGKLNILFITVILSLLSNLKVHSQIQNNGTIYVGQNSSLYTSGTFVFGTSSVTKTERGSGLNHGKLVFGLSAAASGAANSTTKFVDGFVNTRKTGVFDLSTGDGTTYAPVRVTNTAVTNGVEAAYNHATPTNNSDFESSITAILSTGYWVIKGDDAKITLIWSSDIGDDFNAFADITVAGYNSISGKWEAIDCDAPTGSLSSGTVSTSSAVSFASYAAFTIGEKGVECSSLITFTGSKSWTGSAWSPPGNPTLYDAVTLDANYPSTAGSFVCNSLAMGNYNIALTDQQSVEVVNDVTSDINGKIIMSSEASFVQRKSTGTAPSIELTKTTRPIKRYDYVYWGSPVVGDVFSQLSAATATGESNPNAFDLKYKYVSGFSDTSGGWQNLTATANGEGFIMRVKQQAPFINSSATGTINLKFTGTANNGTIPVTLGYASGLTARNNNLLANPYPSAIDADKFLMQNSGVIDGAIYLWRATTSNDGSSNYAVSDYIAYTKAGASALTGATLQGTNNMPSFNGRIASGQGFKVRATGSGAVEFNNCMRVAGDGQNTNFMRTTNSYAAANDSTKDRFNLSLQTTDGIASQLLVAYLPETTLGYDHMYDAEILSTSATKMYSFLDNTTQKLAINARPSFVNTDQVTLGYTKADATPVQMSIIVAHKQGLFANGQTPIYLHDTHLDTYHNFANGAYNFTTSSLEDNVRFKIVYQGTSLNNPAFSSVDVVTMINDRELSIRASSDIEEVTVFDLMGRMILNSKPSDISSSFNSAFNQAVGVYLIKVKLTNGQVVTNKLINKN